MKNRSSNTRTLAAVMFTDMVGFTALMQEDEALARRKRDRHREVLEELHKKYDGRIIQYFGDGTVSTFSSSVNAVQCAVEIQVALREPVEVPLRIGIHAGDIVIEKDNIIGDAVNLASRIESFSVPGAVLVSETVFEQIQNQTHLSVVSLGQFSFKNVKKPTKVYALTNDGLVVPSLGELKGKGYRQDIPKHNLPQQLTSFIGREQEIAEISGLVRQGKLVTVTGPGGTGKTRLVLKVAESLTADFKDGLYWIPLASASDLDAASLTMIKALELIQIPSKSTVDILIDFLRHKEALLILDNFEQILEAATILQALLKNCSNLKVLATSRIVLNLQMEWEYSLRPLQVPVLNGNNGLERLLGYSSMNLFCQRAKAVNSNFNLNDQNVLAVANICRRLDGLPLALELAAARIKIFSPRALLSRLDRHLDLLKAENPDRPARHHTLRQTINWSYQLLPEKERRLFNRLSIFSRGSYLEAAESVCGQNGLDQFEIAEHIYALVNKSLVNREEDSEGEVRFSLLETIRAFAHEKLEEQEEPENLREAHALYFVARAEEADPHLTGPEQGYWLSLLEEDLDNFREAFNWTIHRRRYELAFRLGIALWRLWIARGMLKEGLNNAHRLLNCSVDEGLKPYRAKIVSALIATHFYTQHFAESLVLCKENLTFWQQMNNESEVAKNLNHLGFACINLGEIPAGIRHTNEALDLFKKQKDIRGQSVSYNNFGWGYMMLGEPKKALPNLNQSLEFRKRIKDEQGIGFAFVNLSMAQRKLGKFVESENSLQEGLKILKKNKSKVIYFWAVLQLGILYYDKNELEKCAQLLRDHQGSYSFLALGIKAWLNLLNGFVAEYYEAREQADRLIEKACQLFQESGNPFRIAIGWYYRSKGEFASGNWKLAWKYLKSSLEINHKHHILLGLAENLELAGMLCASTENPEKAALLLSYSRQMRSELGTPVPPVLEANVEGAWSQLKEQLATEKLEALIREGESMSREEILNLIPK